LCSVLARKCRFDFFSNSHFTETLNNITKKPQHITIARSKEEEEEEEEKRERDVRLDFLSVAFEQQQY
jgi:hypothetical protein